MNRTDWLAERNYPTPSVWLALPAAFQFFKKVRAELSIFDPDVADGRLALYFWWERSGRLDYPDLDWYLSNQEVDLLDSLTGEELCSRFPEAMAFWLRGSWTSALSLPCLDSYLLDNDPKMGSSGIGVPRFLGLILSRRPDLRNSYSTDSVIGLAHFLKWWMTNGRKEYQRVIWSPKHIIESFSMPDAGTETLSAIPLPLILKRFWIEKEDLKKAFDLNSTLGCINYLEWWEDNKVLLGLESIRFPLLTPEDILDDLSEIKNIPVFLLEIYRSRKDLADAFDINTSEGRENLRSWWECYGRKEYPSLGGISLAIDEQISLSDPLLRNGISGVNVVGYPRGVLGIGEDSRVMGMCLERAGIPSILVEVPYPGPEKLIDLPPHKIGTALKFDTTVFCLPPYEMMRMALEGGKVFIDNNSYKIGAWPWELPHWPIAYEQIYEFVDEIWAQSRFVQKAFSHRCDLPINYMPMAVSVPAPIRNLRQELKLPEKDFLFYILFDGNSWLSRKNPIAAIKAFLLAFPGRGAGVGLIIKAMNVRGDDPSWQEIQRIAASDPRLIVIDAIMSRQQTIDLMNSCDAYISLHRSEGFGRVIAESMLLEKPVVVTNFSGNVDYCNSDTAYLVNGELVPIRSGEYQMTEGAYWCDPDVEMAAEHLRDVVEDKNKRCRIAKAGKAIIQEKHSADAVALAYQIHMKTIKDIQVL